MRLYFRYAADSGAGNVPVMNKISQTLGRSFAKSAAYKNAVLNVRIMYF